MSNQSKQSVEKKQVSREEFDKKVEFEAAHLEYMDRMRWDEAMAQARKTVGAEYEVR